MKEHRRDITDVRALIQLYVDDASGDVAKLKEAFHPEHDDAGCDFVDYFTLARIHGRWWITNKTYAHSGGSMLAA